MRVHTDESKMTKNTIILCYNRLNMNIETSKNPFFDLAEKYFGIGENVVPNLDGQSLVVDPIQVQTRVSTDVDDNDDLVNSGVKILGKGADHREDDR